MLMLMVMLIIFMVMFIVLLMLINIVAQIWQWRGGAENDSKLKQPVPTETPSWPPQLQEVHTKY